MISEKNYIVIDVAEMVDMTTDEGSEIWAKLTDHHCFVKYGNFELNKYFCFPVNNLSEELDSENYDITVGSYFAKKLQKAGYEDISNFDGVLLDIDW